MKGEIIHLDEVLTMSTKMAIATGDPQWEKRYLYYEPLLDNAINQAMKLAPVLFRDQAVNETEKSNTRLVEMEKRAFGLIRMGRTEEAGALINSSEYENLKIVYADGMNTLSSGLEDTIKEMRDIEARQSSLQNLLISILIVILAICWVFVFRSIHLWKEQLSYMNNSLDDKVAELSKLRNYLFNVINSMPSVLIGVDSNGNVTQWNNKAELETGIPFLEAQGKPLQEVFRRMPFDMEKIRHSMKSLETSLLHKVPHSVGGEVHYEDFVVYPLIADGMIGAVIRLDDVTEKSRMEELLVQNERLLTAGKLAAGMAHEINNPLGGIILMIQVLENRLVKKVEGPDEFKAFLLEKDVPRLLRTISDSGRRIANIVTNIYEYSRIDESVFELHDLEELIEKTLELSTLNLERIEIIKDFEEELPSVMCDGTKILQVLQNLFSNSIEAMEEGKTEHPRLIFRLYSDKAGDKLILEVEDNGPGMSEEVRERVFDPFYTTKPFGMANGLGLFVSYLIIRESHKGELSVETKEGSGTKFILSLPTR